MFRDGEDHDNTRRVSQARVAWDGGQGKGLDRDRQGHDRIKTGPD